MVGRPMLRQPPFRNNARLVLLATAGALVAFLAVQLLLRKSRDFAPDFLASVLLYGLTVLNLTLLLVLLFVLGRNLVRVLLERRRGVLGARLRMQLLLVFLLMAVAPSVLLIFCGSDLIQQTVRRRFNVDVERILCSSQALGTAVREGAGGARSPGAVHEVPQGPVLQRPHQGRLPLVLPLPGPARPLRRGLALPLPRPTHHHPPAARGRGSGADRGRRAPGQGGLPGGDRRVRGSHRLLQSDVGAPGPQRGGGGVQ